MQYVLVRIFGTNDALFSRDDEQDIFRRVAAVGLGPKLLVSPVCRCTSQSCSHIPWPAKGNIYRGIASFLVLLGAVYEGQALFAHHRIASLQSYILCRSAWSF